MELKLSEHFTYKKLILYVLPCVAMMILTSVYSIVDGFFVSNYAGKTAFAAVNLIMPLLLVLGCVGFMFGTGGGALINDKTAEFARESGISVYINTPFEVCYERIKNDSNRPLVVNNTPKQLRQLYDTRSAIYRRNSMYMVNGNARDSVICGEIVKLVKCFEANGLNN